MCLHVSYSKPLTFAPVSTSMLHWTAWLPAPLLEDLDVWSIATDTIAIGVGTGVEGTEGT